MDYRQENEFFGGNVVQIVSRNFENGVSENCSFEDNNGIWNKEASVDTNSNSNSNYDVRQSQSRFSNERYTKDKEIPNPQILRVLVGQRLLEKCFQTQTLLQIQGWQLSIF